MGELILDPNGAYLLFRSANLLQISTVLVPTPPCLTDLHQTTVPRIAYSPPQPHGPTLHPSLPLVLSSVLRVVSLPLSGAHLAYSPSRESLPVLQFLSCIYSHISMISTLQL